MQYTEIEQNYLDIDWFITDSNGEIAHLASGGCALPAGDLPSKEDNEMLLRFFNSLSPYSKINVNHNPKQGDITCFEDMAKRGLYSFNTVATMNLNCSSYCRVAFPVKPLNIAQLPENIRDILLKTGARKISFKDIIDLDWKLIF